MGMEVCLQRKIPLAVCFLPAVIFAGQDKEQGLERAYSMASFAALLSHES